MAEAAQELGLQYLGIADHSKSSFQANGLDATRLRKQIAEIRAMNADFDGFRLFAGSEVDILKDGSLDFDDDLLAELDYVVGQRAQRDESARGRDDQAHHQGHRKSARHHARPRHRPPALPTARLRRERPRHHRRCGRNRHHHRDSTPAPGGSTWTGAGGSWPRRKASRCSINPDAHSTRGLQDVFFGIRSARKGWLERGDVVNTLPLGEIEAILQDKRSV